MTAIRAIYDGKAFIPREPVSLPAGPEVVLYIQVDDGTSQTQLDVKIQTSIERSGQHSHRGPFRNEIVRGLDLMDFEHRIAGAHLAARFAPK